MRTVLLFAALAACHFSSTAAGVAADGAATTEPDAPVTPTARCDGKPAGTGDQTWTITSGGTSRIVYAHVPPNYDPTRPTALVFNFHGFTSDALQEAVLSLMNDKADSEGFIVLYPVGTGAPLSWNAGACCGTATASNVDDIQFVRDILAAASDKLCIDPARVYATGMSNGGFLSHRIGCELADRFAAIAPVAGVLGIDACTPSRPMPVMHFHGTQDSLVPYDGSASLGFPSVASTFAGWAQRDHCTGDPVETYRNGNASCSTYQHCDGGADVTLCTINGGGHTWPGGTPVPSLGLTSTDIHATDAMWTFFAQHHL
ncbi:MAG: prolyl oligopeptidase family serine peptidase [Deltaproteobacteria bacterium]|nr:prolyl oligopeptidase family serine peptidase [Deltaproteobacteria bacterium]